MKYKFKDIQIESVKQINEDTPIFQSKDKVVTAKSFMKPDGSFDFLYNTKDGNEAFAQVAFLGDYMVTLKDGLSFILPKVVFEELFNEV